MSERQAQENWWAGKRFWGCTARVHPPGAHRSVRCSKRATADFDADGNPTKCGIHSDEAQKRRDAKTKARREEENKKFARKMALGTHQRKLIDLVRSIASGHNNLRGLCQEWLDELDRIKENP